MTIIPAAPYIEPPEIFIETEEQSGDHPRSADDHLIMLRECRISLSDS